MLSAIARSSRAPMRRTVRGSVGPRQVRPASTGAAATSSSSSSSSEGRPDSVLQKGARRDPELYVLLTVMAGAFGLAGWYFGRKPTSASSEKKVAVAEGSMPWQVDDKDASGGDEDYKYQYHPGGDKSRAPRNAPSALNTVIVPNVNLPKRLHDKYNKWGKDPKDW